MRNTKLKSEDIKWIRIKQGFENPINHWNGRNHEDINFIFMIFVYVNDSMVGIKKNLINFLLVQNYHVELIFVVIVINWNYIDFSAAEMNSNNFLNYKAIKLKRE